MSASPGRLASRQLLASRILATRAAEALSAAQCRSPPWRERPSVPSSAPPPRCPCSIMWRIRSSWRTALLAGTTTRCASLSIDTDATPFNPLLVACVRLGDDSASRSGWAHGRGTPVVDTYGELILARVEQSEALRALRVCGRSPAGIVPPRRACTALIVALSEAGLGLSIGPRLRAARAAQPAARRHRPRNAGAHRRGGGGGDAA